MSTHDSTRALKEKHNAKCGVFGLINLVLQTVLFSCNPTFTEITWCGGIVRYQVAGQTVLFSCNPTFTEITWCGGMSDTRLRVKILIRLADHLTRVHDLSELERKYWLQFAKLQNTIVIRGHNKGAEPKTIFL